METGSFTPQGIIAGDRPLTHQPITILSGQGVRVRGSIMGRISIGAAVAAAKTGGNTGTGTFVLDAEAPTLAGVKVGVYTLRCIAANTNAGTFRLTDPDGFVLGDYTISGGAGGTVAIANDIRGVLTDAGTDFIAGDGFDITVAAGSGKWKLALAAALDGSATPRAILAEDIDATSGDVTAPAYFEGEFASEMLTYGAGYNAATVEAALRAAGRSIYLKSVGAVA